MNFALWTATGAPVIAFLLAVVVLLLLPQLRWTFINRKMLAVRLFRKTGITFFLKLATVSGAAQSVLSNVGATPVAVIAGTDGYVVTVRQTPGSGGAFQVYDASQNLLATIPSSGPGSYQWNVPNNGAEANIPFSAGQTVGFVSVPTGTQNFIVSDTSPVPYLVPASGGIYPAAGAIGQRKGRVFLTGATAQAYTLAAPQQGADDFKEIEIVNVTAQAHTVTTGTNAFDGTTHICTMTAQVGVVLVAMAYQGVWYTQRATGSGLTFS